MSVLLSSATTPECGRIGNLVGVYLISPTCATLTHAMASRWRADLASGLVDRGVAVVSVCTGDLDSTALIGRLQAALAEAGMPSPAVTISMVECLDRHPATGKLRSVIPLTEGGASCWR